MARHPRTARQAAEQRVLIAQDLVYNDVHLYPGNNGIAGWRQVVDAPAADAGYNTILADARELLGDDGEAYKKAIVNRYPSHVGPFIIDIANRSLFGSGH
ncbi:hypothetical protein [Streptomyces massasporeus]|uniref:hypothetical protein n=1 Tax=Streptomyces massasporeus TaxID=67324 RepID=UPI00371AD12F